MWIFPQQEMMELAMMTNATLSRVKSFDVTSTPTNTWCILRMSFFGQPTASKNSKPIDGKIQRFTDD